MYTIIVIISIKLHGGLQRNLIHKFFHMSFFLLILFFFFYIWVGKDINFGLLNLVQADHDFFLFFEVIDFAEKGPRTANHCNNLIFYQSAHYLKNIFSQNLLIIRQTSDILGEISKNFTEI